MLELNTRDREVVELLTQGWSLKRHNEKVVYQQMDAGKIALHDPQNPWRE